MKRFNSRKGFKFDLIYYLLNAYVAKFQKLFKLFWWNLTCTKLK